MTVVLLSCLLAGSAPVWGTLEYAHQTGMPCGACHQAPIGGGSLTPEGAAFRNQKTDAPAAASLGGTVWSVRAVTGFLHLLAAILWLGTILYIHLMMKPSYAARGLPREQVWIGRSSSVVLVVTGLILTYLRLPSLEALLSTRFGILLVVKAGLFLLMIALAILAHGVISPILVQAAERAMAAAGAAGAREFTPAELDLYDGRDGRRAYIAYKGVIYDVTRGGSWLDGVHMGRHQAGQDLTGDLALAPHNDERIREMPVVGRLVPSRGRKPLTVPERIFYVVSYLNFGLALAIVLIVAVWKL